MDDKPVKARSLQNELTYWTFIITLSVCTIGGVTAGLIAYFEARDVRDEVLLQIAQIVSGSDSIPAKSGGYHHRDSTIIVESVEEGSRNLGISSKQSDGFDTIKAKGESWRIYVITKADQQRFVVAQQTELIDEFAFGNAMSAVLPICILAILLLGLIRWIIYSRMKPIIKLSHIADTQTVNNLNPLSTKSIPLEVLPFIEAINRLLLRTKNALTQQRRFIADASHELRTPVTALSLISENLEKADSPDLQNEQLKLLRHGLDRLNNLVNQLLNLTRLQNTESKVVEEVQFDELVKDVVVLFYPLAERKEIDLGITQISPVNIQNIDGRIKQLVENAIANAIHYTPSHGKIDISLSIKNRFVNFEVSDSGPGIDENEIDAVLTPFYRGKDNAEPGSGLGLAICVEIAKQHDGKITLKNRKEGGLTFAYAQAISP